jgi:hypothetical protein
MFNNFIPKIVLFMRQCGKKKVESDRPQMTIWRMHLACWITETMEITRNV